MNSSSEYLRNELTKMGWTVRVCSEVNGLPEAIIKRYDWLPEDVIEFVSSIEFAASADDRCWFVGSEELAGTSGSAFKWNQWELESIEAANGDEQWKQSIRDFWDKHFPLAMSVRDGYRYVAIRDDLQVVRGEEPEFEETEVLASSFSEFAREIAASAIEKFL